MLQESRNLLSIIIPVFRSAQTLPLLVSEVERVLLESGICYEIVLVDDCSGDDTWETIANLSIHSLNVRGIRLSENVGQFEATLIGIRYSLGDLIVNMDDDLEHPIQDIPKLYHQLKSSPQLKIIFGMDRKKYQKKGKSTRLQEFRNIIVNLFWGKYPTDSFRIFKRSMVFKEDKFLVEFPMLEIYMKHYVRRKEVSYVHVDFQKRQHGVSGYNFRRKLAVFFEYSPYYFSKSSFYIIGVFSFLFFSIAIVYWKGTLFIALPFYILLILALMKRNKKIKMPSYSDSVNFNTAC